MQCPPTSPGRKGRKFHFVPERDVDVALRVLDDLGGLGDLDGLRAVHAGLHHQLVDLRHAVERLGVHAGDNLHDGLQAVHLVARVDALGAVAYLEVNAALQAALLLEDRNANVLGHTRPHS